MKFLPVIDKWLPKTPAYHVKIAIGAIVVSFLFELLKQEPFTAAYLTYALTFLQLEIFIWLGTRMFRKVEGSTPRQLIRNVLVRLALFYLLVLSIAAMIFVAVLAFDLVSRGASLSELAPRLLNDEMRGFLTGSGFGILLGTIFFFFMTWQEGLEREQRLIKEKLIFQYETLKNQVNPHFLFNSLNTLSSIIHSEPSLAEKFIGKLSGIYRYVLENKDKEFVSLSAELKLVEDYFYLQKIRDGDKIVLDIRMDERDSYKILPLSLQILIENALKHNAATRESPLKIEISLEEGARVAVKNNLQRKKLLGRSPGLGLKNLDERLKLMANAGLEVIETENEFIVKAPAVLAEAGIMSKSV